ncbi:MAG: penicillin-binding protein 2 [Bifidobacteriaceae bacterium]|jgi:cell division protein FtsI (penicillin-binding protein 3)|nr:penicillin-binding protein 2 [Bifidobacteriaceae bacterium]
MIKKSSQILRISRTFNRRLFYSVLVLAILGCVIASQLIWYQVINSEDTAQKAKNSRIRTESIPAARGNIIDANGIILATAVERYIVYIDQISAAKFIPVICTDANKSICNGDHGTIGISVGPEAIGKILSPILKISAKDIQTKATGSLGYSVVEKNVSPEIERKIQKLNMSHIIGTVMTPKRAYPDGTIAGNIIGSVNDAEKGSAGIEQMMDSTLSGKDGKISYESGLLGQEIPTGYVDVENATSGKDVQLTLDQDVQYQVQQTLNQGCKDNAADYGMAVVQEVKTGKILAIADSFSPAAGSDEAALHISKTVTDVFEPGSTGKVVTVAGLLENNYANPLSQYEVPDHWTDPAGQEFQDAETHGVQRLTLTGVLANSSNVGTLLASQAVPNKQRYEWLVNAGFGKNTGLGLPGESPGLVIPYQDWDERTRQTVMFGQAIAVNAVQATSFFSAIGNSGIRVTPSIIAGVKDGENFDPVDEPKKKQIISRDAAKKTLEMMESVVTEGMVKNFVIPNYRMAGKTGTSQLADSSGKLNDIMASFIGVGPVQDPKWTVSVFYKNPRTQYFGALAAGPVFKKIMTFLLAKYGVAPSSGSAKYSISW